MKLISPLLAASLLLSLTPVVRAMELEDWDQEPETTTQSIANFMQGLSRPAQIGVVAKYIADLQPEPTIKSDENIEIAAAAIDFLTKSNPRTLTDIEKAQLISMTESVCSFLEANDDIAQSPNGQYLAGATANLTSFIAQDPKADASGDEGKEDAKQQQELDPLTLANRITAGQKYVEARMEQAAMGLAAFVEANPEIAKLPQRLITSQAKLLEHEFKGKNFSLDALRKKQLLASAEMLKHHAEKPEEVNQLAIFLDYFKISLDLGFQEINKFAPPAKASAKTAARLWANADWASVLPGLQQATDSFMTCLSTVLSNYEAEVADISGNVEEVEDEDDKAAAEEQEAQAGIHAAQDELNRAQAALDSMFANLHTSSSSSSSASTASVELP